MHGIRLIEELLKIRYNPQYFFVRCKDMGLSTNVMDGLYETKRLTSGIITVGKYGTIWHTL